MFIIRLIRRLFSLLRSNLTSHEIALGCCLGLWLGCIPFSSVWAVGAIVLITLLLRASFSAFIAGAVVTKALGFLLNPFLFSLGEFALEGPPAPVFGAAVKQPVLALLDLHRYVVAGSVFFLLICLAVCYPVVYFLSQKYRKSLIKWSENSQAYDRFTRFPLIRFLTWLFMGKKKGDLKETLETRKSPVRKGAVVLLVVFIVVLCLFLTFFGDPLAKAGLEAGMTQATDSKVEVKDLALDFLDGSLGLEDLFVYKKDEEKGIVHAVSLKGDLNITAFLKRHLVFDEIAIQNMDFRVARDEHGNLNLPGKRKPEEEIDPDAGKLLDAKNLSDLWQKKGLANDLLDHLLDYLFSEKTEDPSERIEEIKRDVERLKNYAAYFADFLLEGNQPLVVVEKLRISGLKLKMEDAMEKGPGQVFNNLTVLATALSSNPRLYGKDSLIEVGDAALSQGPFYMKFTFNWSSPDPVHTLELRLADLPAEVVTDYIKPGDDLLFSGGSVGLTADVALSRQGLESKWFFTLQGVDVSAAKKGSKVLGLDSDLFCRGITEFLKNAPLETEVAIAGPYDNLSIEVDDKGLIDSVKEGIQRTGEQLLKEEFNKQLDQVQAKADEKLDKAGKRLDKKMDKVEDKLKDKLGDQLGGDIGKDLKGLLGDDEKGEDDKNKGLLDQARGLFGNKKKKDDEKKEEK